jgi:hypothetical protein
MLPSSMGWMLVLVFEVSIKILRRATMDFKFKGRKDLWDNSDRNGLASKLERKHYGEKRTD